MPAAVACAVFVRHRLALISALLTSAALLTGPADAAPAKTKAPDDTLQQSVQGLKQFPFRPNCDGNTQEIVACLWQRRNQQDSRLQRQLGSSSLLEQWRRTRRQVCAKAAAKAEGGSMQPIVGLSCENTLNAALQEQISQPLLDH